MTDILLTTIEIIGIISFGISGAIVAIDKGMDLFGVIFLSLVTCFGGGIMRDLILDREVAFFGALFENNFVLVAAVTSLAVFLFARFCAVWYVEREKQILRINNYIDALGLGAFCVSTVRICLNINPDISAFFAISMGVIASIGGGMIRDICLNDIPFVLRKHIYAAASIVGSTFYYLCAAVFFRGNDAAEIVCAIIAILLVFVIRVLATIFKWNFPIVFPQENLGVKSANDKKQLDKVHNNSLKK